MNIKQKMMLGSALPIVMAAALTMGTTAANATTILAFSQVGTGSNVTITNNAGDTQSTLSVVNQEVTVTACLGCGPLTSPDELTISATSIGPASSSVVGGVTFVSQTFSGTFSITGPGQNVLSGTFTDATFGSGTSLTLSVSNSTVGEALNFTSSVIPNLDLHNPEGLSFSFANVSPPAAVVGSGCPTGVAPCTLASASMSVTGDASATPAPEPSTLALFGASLLTLGGLTWRRKRRRA